MSRTVFSAVLAFFLSTIAATTALAEEPHEPVTHRFCFTCHGTDGIGSEGIQAPRLAGMEPWYLKRQLELFRAGGRGTHPMDIEGMEMQPMAAIMTDAEIDDVVQWASTWEDITPQPTIHARDVEPW